MTKIVLTITPTTKFLILGATGSQTRLKNVAIYWEYKPDSKQ